MLIDLLRELKPNGEEKLPKLFYVVKKITGGLGFWYERTDSCPNDCVQNCNLTKCSTCKISRWRIVELQQEHSKRKKQRLLAGNYVIFL